MLLLEESSQLTSKDRDMLKKFTGRTLEATLSYKEETINVMERFDMMLSLSWKGEYIEASIFQLAVFNMPRGRKRRYENLPVYSGRRHLHKKEDMASFIDAEKVSFFSKKDAEAFQYVCELFRTFEVKVNSVFNFSCTWNKL